LPDAEWDNITEMGKLEGFEGLVESFVESPEEWKEWYLANQPESFPLIGNNYS
jgi:hypothetical protein